MHLTVTGRPALVRNPDRAQARSSALTKVAALRHRRAHIDGTGCSPLVTAFVAEQVGLPTREDLQVDTIGHALDRAIRENA